MDLQNNGQQFHKKQYNMIAIEHNGIIKKFSKLPKVWKDQNGTHINITDGADYGFYDVVTPEFNSATQYLGDIEWDADNSVFTYPVIDKTWNQTLAELKSDKINGLKNIYNKKLANTDWIIIRDKELGNQTDQSILDERQQLRDDCLNHEQSINSKTTKADVAQYDILNLI